MVQKFSKKISVYNSWFSQVSLINKLNNIFYFLLFFFPLHISQNQKQKFKHFNKILFFPLFLFFNSTSCTIAPLPFFPPTIFFYALYHPLLKKKVLTIKPNFLFAKKFFVFFQFSVGPLIVGILSFITPLGKHLNLAPIKTFQSNTLFKI
jgi:hypothetical protein